MNEEINELKNKNNELQEKIQSSTEENNNLNEKINTLETDKKELENKVTELSKDETNPRIMQLIDENTKLKDKLFVVILRSVILNDLKILTKLPLDKFK